MTARKFDSIDDVVRYIRGLEPAFAELRPNDLRDLVTEHTQHNCENLTDDEIAELVEVVKRATIEKPTA